MNPLPYIQIILKYGPQVINNLMKAARASKKESIGHCSGCGSEVYADAILSIDLVEDLLYNRAIACNRKDCKAFAAIQNLGKENDYF